MMRRIAPHAFLTVALIFCVLAAWEPSLIPTHGQICSEPDNTGHKECATYHASLVALWHIAKFFDDHEGAVTALGTLAIAAFTFTLWRSTRRLWRATNDTLDHARDTAERQLRAYVSPIIGMILDLDFNSPLQPFGVRIVFKNSGQTPAYDFKSTGKVDLAAFPLVTELNEEDAREPTAAVVIGPGAEFHLNMAAKAITQHYWDGLRSEQIAFYVHGSYIYRDAFEQTRTGTFLYRYGGKDGLRIDRALTLYGEGNKAD